MSKFHATDKNSSRGSISIVAAFSMLLIIGFAGLTIDFGYAYLQKNRAQNTADAEALACVINDSASPCGATAGDINPLLNPFGFTVGIVSPGDNSLCTLPLSQNYCARSTVTVTWDTFLIRILGVPTLTVTATATAGKVNAIASCVITTSNFSANGTNHVQLNSCSASIAGILSSTNQSGINISGPGNITVFNGNSPDLCGNCSPHPISTLKPLPVIPSNAIPTTNIDGSVLPTLSYKNCTNSSCIPAIYTGGQVTLKSNTVLRTGNYVFNGGFSTGGNNLSSGVGGIAIYVPGDQALDLSGTVTLSAPIIAGCTAGSGIVISHPYMSSYNSLTLNGSKNQLTLNGLVNLSADDVTVSGSSAGLSVTGSFITHSISLNGDMYPQLSTNPCFNLYENAGSVVLVN